MMRSYRTSTRPFLVRSDVDGQHDAMPVTDTSVASPKGGSSASVAVVSRYKGRVRTGCLTCRTRKVRAY